MRTVVLDFETYYDKEYSLRKMTPVEYILDPRYETIMCAAIEFNPSIGNRTDVIDGPDFNGWLKTAELNKCCVVSHNALFDMSILAWRYNVRPRLMVDTLGVSRALLGHRLKSLGLASVAQHLELGFKGHEVQNVIGMTRKDIINSGRWPGYAEYNKNDAELCAGIYDRLVRTGLFPMREIAVMDMVLRCATEPKLFLDQQAIATHLADVQQKKLEMLASAMLCGAQNGKSDLMSNEKFAELLRQVNCEPPKRFPPLRGSGLTPLPRPTRSSSRWRNIPTPWCRCWSLPEPATRAHWKRAARSGFSTSPILTGEVTRSSACRSPFVMPGRIRGGFQATGS